MQPHIFQHVTLKLTPLGQDLSILDRAVRVITTKKDSSANVTGFDFEQILTDISKQIEAQKQIRAKKQTILLQSHLNALSGSVNSSGSKAAKK